MTDLELRRLSRADLLELLIIERREIDRLNAEINKTLEELSAVTRKLEAATKELSAIRENLKNGK
ncbi:MAG: hypothetical protein IJS90_06185 [Clostridia bacterium]|nr:hypothetical protein [Clostridia bacterium]